MWSRLPGRVIHVRIHISRSGVKTLVPSEPQVIAGIYGCEQPTKNVSIGIDPYPNIYWFIVDLPMKNGDFP